MDAQIKEYREKQKEKYKELILSSAKCKKQNNKNITINIKSTNYCDSDDSDDSEEDDSDDSEEDDSDCDDVIIKSSKTTTKTTKHTTKNRKKSIPSTVKRLVWNKYIGENIGKYKCYCCKLTDITQLSFHCGHVISEKNGGKIDIDNLRPICQNCNSSMGITNMNDFISEYNIHK